MDNASIILPPKQDPDAEDLAFLGSAGAVRRIGIPVGVNLKPEAQRALIRAQNSGWVTLVDLEMGMHAGMEQNGPMLTRVFRVTDAGARRVNEIKERRRIDLRVKGDK